MVTVARFRTFTRQLSRLLLELGFFAGIQLSYGDQPVHGLLPDTVADFACELLRVVPNEPLPQNLSRTVGALRRSFHGGSILSATGP